MTINIKKLDQIRNSLLPECDLMIVSKNRSVSDIEKLILNGEQIFGENRVIEAEEKFLKQLNKYSHKINLHLIGQLQSRKVKKALEIFDVIQSIDRDKIVEIISDEIDKNINIKTKSFFIQINIGNEKQKSGIDPKYVNDFYRYAVSKKLNIRGFMCIPPNDDNPSIYFKEMNTIKDSINTKLKLSMGMSNDYKLAIKFKSNMVRIGSLIFN